MFYSSARRFISMSLVASLLSSSVMPAFAGIDDDNDAVSSKAVVATKASVPGVPNQVTDFSAGMSILLDMAGSQNPSLVGEILRHLPPEDRLVYHFVMNSNMPTVTTDSKVVEALRRKFAKLKVAVFQFNQTEGKFRIREDVLGRNLQLFANGAKHLVIDRANEALSHGFRGLSNFGPDFPSLKRVKFLDITTACDYGLALFFDNVSPSQNAEIHLNILQSLDSQQANENDVTEDVAGGLLAPLVREQYGSLGYPTQKVFPPALKRLKSLSVSAKHPKTVLTFLQKFKAIFLNERDQELSTPPQVAFFLSAALEPTTAEYVALRKFLRKYVHVFTRDDVIAGSVLPNGAAAWIESVCSNVNAYTLSFAKDLFLQGEDATKRIDLLNILNKYQPTTLRETIPHAKTLFTPNMTSEDKGKIIDALAQVRPSWREGIAREALSMTGGFDMIEQLHVTKYSQTLPSISFDDLRTTFSPAGAPGGAAWVPSEMISLMEVLRFSPQQNHASALNHIKSFPLDTLSFEKKRDVFRDLLSYPAARHEDLVRYVRELTADVSINFHSIFKSLASIDPLCLDSAMTHGRKLWKNGEADIFKAEIIKKLGSLPITHHEDVSRHVASFVSIQNASFDQIVLAIGLLGSVPVENLERAVEHGQKLLTPGMYTEMKLQVIRCLGGFPVDCYEGIAKYAIPFITDTMTLEEISSVIGTLAAVPTADLEDVMPQARSFFTGDMTIGQKIAYTNGIFSCPPERRAQIVNTARTVLTPRVNLEGWETLCSGTIVDLNSLFSEPLQGSEISATFEWLGGILPERLDASVASALKVYEDGDSHRTLLSMIGTFGMSKPKRHDAIISLVKAVKSNPPSGDMLGSGNAPDGSGPIIDADDDAASSSGSNTHIDDDSSSHSGSGIDADDNSASGSQQEDAVAIDVDAEADDHVYGGDADGQLYGGDANDQLYDDVNADGQLYGGDADGQDNFNILDQAYWKQDIVGGCARIFAKVSVRNIAKAIRFAEPFLTSDLDWGSKLNLIDAFVKTPEMSDVEMETFQNHLKTLFDYKVTLHGAATCIKVLQEMPAEVRGPVVENFAYAITKDLEDREEFLGEILWALGQFPVADMKEAAPLIAKFFAGDHDESTSDYGGESSDFGYYTAQNSDASSSSESDSDSEYDSFGCIYFSSDSTSSDGVINSVPSEKRLAFIKTIVSSINPEMNIDQRFELLKKIASDMGYVLVRDEKTSQGFESVGGTESDDETSSQSSESVSDTELDDEMSSQRSESIGGTKSDDESDDELSSHDAGSFEGDEI